MTNTVDLWYKGSCVRSMQYVSGLNYNEILRPGNLHAA
jgi:hypothetical protein